MLTRADLDEAVKAGIITEQQSIQLQGLPAQRRDIRRGHATRDERFVFMKNFNEFFIALGIVLFGSGLWAAASTLPYSFVVFPVVFIAVMWALAEYLTLRLKLTLPSIVIAAFMVGIIPAFIFAYFGEGTLLISSVSALVVALLFYLRFRLPFALLLLAGGSVATLYALFTAFVGEPTQSAMYGLFFFSGLAALTAALWYDMSDRERLTRRSECAFWLTLIAAPLIVHPIVGLIASDGEMSIQASLTTIVVVAFFALIALIIDRRAFLVSSLVYLGGAIAYALTSLGGAQNAAWITLLLLGAGVVLLGVGWQRARRTVMQFVPAYFAEQLPVLRS
jgi:hypothetical protein